MGKSRDIHVALGIGGAPLVAFILTAAAQVSGEEQRRPVGVHFEQEAIDATERRTVTGARASATAADSALEGAGGGGKVGGIRLAG